jgi:AP-4 complex subunit mu-1
VGATRIDVSPPLILELLARIFKIIKDFCGYFNEEIIRKNFVLIYEILDEIIDFGCPQLTSSE